MPNTKIAIIDDEGGIVRSLIRGLRGLDYTNVIPYIVDGSKVTVQGAIQDILDAEEKFDIVVTDLQMPQGTGFEVADALKDEPTLVILSTAKPGLPGIAERLQDDRFVELLAKPYRAERLVEVIEEHKAD